MSPIVYRGDFVYGEFHEPYDFARAQDYIKESASLCRQKKMQKSADGDAGSNRKHQHVGPVQAGANCPAILRLGLASGDRLS